MWQREDLKNIKHSVFGAYADAKKQLDKIPFALAWDLNRYQATILAKKFESYGVEAKFQGGLPSTFAVETAEPKKPSQWLSLVYGSVGLGLLFALIFVFLDRRKDANTPTAEAMIHKPALPESRVSPLPQIDLNRPLDSAPSAPSAQSFQAEQPMERNSVEYILSSTVFISGESSLGSGFLVTDDGYILSNSHVTRNMQNPIVTLKDGRQYEARKIKEDAQYDISLIKIDERALPYLKLGDANKVFAGDPVITIGNPGGLSFTVTRGIVSFNGRRLENVPYIQTDAAINRGNSGGPMINQNLEVIGINTLTSINERGISFALPINLACDDNGITSRIGTDPSSCPTYISPQEKMDMGRAMAQRPTGANIYQQEAESLQKRLMADEQEIQAKNDALQQRGKDLIAQAEQDPLNGTLRERVNTEIEEIKRGFKALEREQAEARARYLNGVVGILERQILDPAYSSGRIQIEKQLKESREARQKLIDFLNQ